VVEISIIITLENQNGGGTSSNSKLKFVEISAAENGVFVFATTEMFFEQAFSESAASLFPKHLVDAANDGMSCDRLWYGGDFHL
jgi:hypothetical protein